MKAQKQRQETDIMNKLNITFVQEGLSETEQVSYMMDRMIQPKLDASAEKDGMNKVELQKFFDNHLADINGELPNYARIKKVELMPEDFERTPKKSIKRYLYQRN